MRNALVHAQLYALGIDQDEPHLLRRGAVEQAHDHGVDGHGFARARRSRDEHVRHRRQIGGYDAAVDVLAHGEREPRLGLGEGFALDHVAQVNGFFLVVGHLDADGAFAGHALDQNAFGAHGQAQVVGQAGDARVFHAGFGLELEGRHHGPGVDLHHLAAHIELGAFLHQHFGLFAQLILAHRLRASPAFSSVLGGSLKPLTCLGATVAVRSLGIGAAVNGDLPGGPMAGAGAGPDGGAGRCSAGSHAAPRASAKR